MSSSEDEVSSNDNDAVAVDGTPGTLRNAATNGLKDSVSESREAVQANDGAVEDAEEAAPEPSSSLRPLFHEVESMDILLGRGALAIRHPGNVNFGHIVALRKGEYKMTSHRRTKDTIAKQVMQAVRNSNGRFVRKVEGEEEMALYSLGANETAWIQVEDSVAILKVKQSLRDKDNLRINDSLRRKRGDMDEDDSETKPKRAKKKQRVDGKKKAPSPVKKSSAKSAPARMEPPVVPLDGKPRAVDPFESKPRAVAPAGKEANGNMASPPSSGRELDESAFSSLMASNASSAAAAASVAKAPPSTAPPGSLDETAGDGATTARILAAANAALEGSNLLDALAQGRAGNPGVASALGNNIGDQNLDALQALLQLRQANASSTVTGQQPTHGMGGSTSTPHAISARDLASLQGGLGNNFASMHNGDGRDMGLASSLRQILETAQRNQLQEELQRRQLQQQLESALYAATAQPQLNQYDATLLSMLQGGGANSMPPPAPQQFYPSLPNNMGGAAAYSGLNVSAYNSAPSNSPLDDEVLRQQLLLSLLSGNSNANANNPSGGGSSNFLGFPF